MSSRVSYNYRVIQEEERQRAIAQRAQLEAQRARRDALEKAARARQQALAEEARARQQALAEEARARQHALEEEQRRTAALHRSMRDLATEDQLLDATASEFNVQISLPDLSRPTDTLTADELTALVSATRKELDAAEEQLHVGLRRQVARAILGEPSSLGLQTESAPNATADDDLGDEASETRKCAAAAVDLLVRQGARCADGDFDELQRRCDAIGQMGLPSARTALRDLENRLSESIRRRKHQEESTQMRARLLYLATEAPVPERNGLQKIVREAQDEELINLQSVVEVAVERESIRRARIGATEKVLLVLNQADYNVDESFSDLLNHKNNEVVLSYPHDPDYGLRVHIDNQRNRIHMAIVHRDDVGPGSDRAIQEQICKDIDGAVKNLKENGLQVAIDNRQGLVCKVPTMPGQLWPERAPRRAGLPDQEQTAPLRAEQAPSNGAS
jgi:hypothetical protein